MTDGLGDPALDDEIAEYVKKTDGTDFHDLCRGIGANEYDCLDAIRRLEAAGALRVERKWGRIDFISVGPLSGVPRLTQQPKPEPVEEPVPAPEPEQPEQQEQEHAPEPEPVTVSAADAAALQVIKAAGRIKQSALAHATGVARDVMSRRAKKLKSFDLITREDQGPGNIVLSLTGRPWATGWPWKTTKTMPKEPKMPEPKMAEEMPEPIRIEDDTADDMDIGPQPDGAEIVIVIKVPRGIGISVRRR
jgi:hypothetical protein